jgi:hypothetical protein
LTIEESSFYKRFSPGLVRLLKMLLSRAFEECIGVGRSLKGPLAAFKDVILTDSTVIRLHALLEKRFPACRTNHTRAALKAHAIMSVRGVGEHSIKVTAGRAHDDPFSSSAVAARPPPDVRPRLLPLPALRLHRAERRLLRDPAEGQRRPEDRRGPPCPPGQT